MTRPEATHQPERDQSGSGLRPEIPVLLEHRDRLRAERLARLKRAAVPAAAAADAEAFEAFLGALKGALRSPRPVRAGAPAAILRFARAPEPAPLD